MATPTYTPLATTTLASATNSVTFGSIPTGTYRDLIIIMDGDTAASTRPVLRLNGDTSSSYSGVMMADDTASAGYSTTSSGTYLDPIPGFGVTGRFSAIWQVFDKDATDKHKSILVRLNQHAGAHVHATAGRWASTSPVTSVTLLTNDGDNYSIGMVMSLYGIH